MLRSENVYTYCYTVQYYALHGCNFIMYNYVHYLTHLTSCSYKHFALNIFFYHSIHTGVDNLQSKLAKEESFTGKPPTVNPLAPSNCILISAREKIDCIEIRFFCMKYCNGDRLIVKQKSSNECIVTFSTQEGKVVNYRVAIKLIFLMFLS